MIARPQVLRLKQKVPQPALDWAQSKADEAYATPRPKDGQLETASVRVCASKGAVPPHTDDHPGTEGRMIVGLVLRSDGHVLHTDHAPEGRPLEAGDLYIIDPRDRHWTTCPTDDSQLIFTVYIMELDRSPKKLAHDFMWELIAASIEAHASGR